MCVYLYLDAVVPTAARENVFALYSRLPILWFHPRFGVDMQQALIHCDDASIPASDLKSLADFSCSFKQSSF